MNFFALFGIGIELNDNIEIGVDYSFPFSENSFYSTDQDYNTNTHEGNIFSETFNTQLDGNKLNEYKFRTLALRIHLVPDELIEE